MASSIIPQKRTRLLSRGSGSTLFRRLVAERLSRLEGGVVRLEDADLDEEGTHRSDVASDLSSDRLDVVLKVHHPRFYKDAVLGGSVGVAQSYIDGDWSCDRLVDLIRLFVRNLDLTDELDGKWTALIQRGLRFWHLRNRNTREGSRKNIQAHYDLSNEFFEKILDPTMTYSCGIFENDDATLEDASVVKIERLCRKLRLHSEDHLLEIGTGWGALAIHAAKHHGCRVTTTTISDRQFEHVRRRIEHEGLEDRITLVKKDYRDLQGTFDKLVSVEMIEAVGHQFFGSFFETCGRLLAPHGVMAIQAITIEDRHFEKAKKEVDFIKKFVFPGSCIPSIEALLRAATRNSDLKLFHLEDITPHYVRTLQEWRQNFDRNRDDILEMGFSETFMRLWEFYLAYCEGGFAERHIGDVQMVLTKPRALIDPILPPLDSSES